MGRVELMEVLGGGWCPYGDGKWLAKMFREVLVPIMVGIRVSGGRARRCQVAIMVRRTMKRRIVGIILGDAEFCALKRAEA